MNTQRIMRLIISGACPATGRVGPGSHKWQFFYRTKGFQRDVADSACNGMLQAYFNESQRDVVDSGKTSTFGESSGASGMLCPGAATRN
jgi:hypothetical protein